MEYILEIIYDTSGNLEDNRMPIKQECQECNSVFSLRADEDNLENNTIPNGLYITCHSRCYNLFLIKKVCCYCYGLLTLTMPNYLIGIIHLQFMALSIIIFRDIKMKSSSWSENSIECCQTARTWWQRLITFGVGRVRVNFNMSFVMRFFLNSK